MYLTLMTSWVFRRYTVQQIKNLHKLSLKTQLFWFILHIPGSCEIGCYDGKLNRVFFCQIFGDLLKNQKILHCFLNILSPTMCLRLLEQKNLHIVSKYGPDHVCKWLKYFGDWKWIGNFFNRNSKIFYFPWKE